MTSPARASASWTPPEWLCEPLSYYIVTYKGYIKELFLGVTNACTMCGKVYNAPTPSAKHMWIHHTTVILPLCIVWLESSGSCYLGAHIFPSCPWFPSLCTVLSGCHVHNLVLPSRLIAMGSLLNEIHPFANPPLYTTRNFEPTMQYIFFFI